MIQVFGGRIKNLNKMLRLVSKMLRLWTCNKYKVGIKFEICIEDAIQCGMNFVKRNIIKIIQFTDKDMIGEVDFIPYHKITSFVKFINIECKFHANKGMLWKVKITRLKSFISNSNPWLRQVNGCRSHGWKATKSVQYWDIVSRWYNWG